MALMAFLLSEHANQAVDQLRVIKMLLIHDLVEIDAGDTYAYDDAGNVTKASARRKKGGGPHFRTASRRSGK